MGVFCVECGTKLERPVEDHCAACGAATPAFPVPSSAAIVLDGTRLLMVRRAVAPWAGCWDIPGGFCEPGEHPRDTARREVLEEAGVEVEIVGLLGAWLGTYEESTNETHGKTSLSIYYIAKRGGEGSFEILGNEVSEVRWFPLSDLPENVSFPKHTTPVLETLKQKFDGRS